MMDTRVLVVVMIFSFCNARGVRRAFVVFHPSSKIGRMLLLQLPHAPRGVIPRESRAGRASHRLRVTSRWAPRCRRGGFRVNRQTGLDRERLRDPARL